MLAAKALLHLPGQACHRGGHSGRLERHRRAGVDSDIMALGGYSSLFSDEEDMSSDNTCKQSGMPEVWPAHTPSPVEDVEGKSDDDDYLRHLMQNSALNCTDENEIRAMQIEDHDVKLVTLHSARQSAHLQFVGTLTIQELSTYFSAKKRTKRDAHQIFHKVTESMELKEDAELYWHHAAKSAKRGGHTILLAGHQQGLLGH